MLYLHVIYTQINIADKQWGMLTFELPAMYWKFPMMLIQPSVNQKLIGCPTLNQEYRKLIG